MWRVPLSTLCSKRLFYYAIGLLCLSLLFINLYGVFSAHTHFERHSEESMIGVPGYDYSLDDSRSLLETSTIKRSPDELTSLVYRAIEHDKTRRIGVSENWLLWLLGEFYPAAATTQNPERIARGGSGLCSEASLVLNHLAAKAGFEARFAKFPAHIVSEIKTSLGWRYFDPDYGISYPVGFGEWSGLRAAAFIEQQLVKRGFSEERVDGYLRAVLVDGTVSVVSLDAPLSPRLFLLEVAADWFVWLLPIVLLGFSVRRIVRG